MSGISSVVAFLSLIGFLVFLGGVGMIVLAASQSRSVRGGVIVAVVGFLFGISLMVVSEGIVVVQPGQVAVVYQTLSGELESPPRGPGTHIIMPILQNHVIYDVTQQEYTMSALGTEGAIRGDDSISARTSDGQNVRLDVTVIYNVDPARAEVLYPRWGASRENYLNGLVRPTVRTVLRDVIAGTTAEELYSTGRSQAQIDAEQTARVTLEREGLQLTSLLVRQVDFSQEFSSAIEAKQTEQQRLQRASIEAQRLEREAQGRAAAVRAEAQGHADAIEINAIAQAEALRMISEQIAANPMLIQYEYIQNLADNVTLALIPSNSPFLFDFDSISSLPQADAEFVAPEVPQSRDTEDSD